MIKFDLSIEMDEGPDNSAQVWTNGRISSQAAKFLFDTGCAQTSLPFNELTSKLPVIRSRESSGAISRTSYDIVLLNHLKIGPIEKSNVEVSRAQKNHLDRYLLGMDLLKNFCLHFKFSDSQVEALQGIEDRQNKIPLTVDKGSIPYVELMLDDVGAKGVWDTGAGITLIDKAFLDRNASMFQELGRSGGTDSTGATIETPIYLMNSVRIGGEIFKPHKVAAIDLSHVNSKIEIPMDFILGFGAISQAHWIFDFPNKAWAISKMIQ